MPDYEPIPDAGETPATNEMPEHITRLVDALDSAWDEQVMLKRLLNTINYPLYDREGPATLDELAHMQRLAYDVMRYAGYVEQQLRYTLYIMGYNTEHTVSVRPVEPPVDEVTEG